MSMDPSSFFSIVLAASLTLKNCYTNLQVSFLTTFKGWLL